MLKQPYYVLAKDGYLAIEMASSEYEAAQKAARRPGYESDVRCRLQYPIEREIGYQESLWKARGGEEKGRC